MRKCSLGSLDAVFERISQGMDLYIPTDDKSGAVFKKWENGMKMTGALNTVRSPKDFFFPQSEDLMEFKVSGKEIEVIDKRAEKEDFAVFGIRACDEKSFDVLDKVFLSEPYDSFYANRRRHATIISMACTLPAETCFCKTFGIDAAEPGGDVVCCKTEDEIYFDAKTEKGEKFLELIKDLLTECDDKKVNEQKAEIRDIIDKLPLKDLPLDKFGAGKTKELFDLPEWAELSEACLGCGTCTFVCPTCQCYDIKDYDTGKGVIRYRCWDSCMYSDFTKMAHGNPRLTQKERFRQRFMHKLVYFPDNNDGMFSCVGCGRCLAKCPISMNIVKVMKRIGG